MTLVSSAVDYRQLNAAVDYRFKHTVDEKQEPHYLFLAEGKNSVVSLLTYNNIYALLESNGLQESIIVLSDDVAPLAFETLQAYLPFFLHDEPDSAFLLGFGGGNTTDMMLIGSKSKSKLEFDFQNIARKMQLGPIAKRMRKLRINQPEDLLWFFQMSRREVMHSVESTISNSDMNIPVAL